MQSNTIIYSNYNNIFSIKPEYYFEPNSLESLIEHIKNNKKIRVFGGKHVFNDIALTPHTMINMKKLNKIIDINLKDQTVKIEAGVKLYQLLEELEKYGLTLPVIPATSYVSVVGAFSTGSHGSNINHGSLSSSVKEITAILYNGEIINIAEGTELLKAFTCGIGCLGVIYTATLKCVPLFAIKENIVTLLWGTFYKNMDTLLKRYEYLEINIDPWQNQSNISNFDITLILRKKIIIDDFQSHNSDDETSFKELFHKNVNFNTKMLTSKYEEYYIETEIAFPLNNIQSVLIAVINFHKKYKNVKSNSSLLLRFSNNDPTLISMNSDRRTVYISTFFGKEVSASVAIKFLKELSVQMTKYNGRPHYGKIHDLDKKLMKKIYGENYLKFKKIKDHLDPEKKFENDYIKKLF